MGDEPKQSLSAERQILNLLYRYAELVDAADFDAVGELFADADYMVDERHPRRHTEVADVMRQFVKLHDGQIRTRHVVTNTIIEFHDRTGSGDDHPHRDASARSYFTVMQATESLALQPIVCGRYLDSFTDDGLGTDSSWRFSKRVISLDLIGDMSEHSNRLGQLQSN